MNWSTASLIAGFIFSTLGMAMLIYGKKVGHVTHILCGAALLVYPFFVTNIWAMIGIGAVFVAGPFVLGDLMG